MPGIPWPWFARSSPVPSAGAVSFFVLPTFHLGTEHELGRLLLLYLVTHQELTEFTASGITKH